MLIGTACAVALNFITTLYVSSWKRVKIKTFQSNVYFDFTIRIVQFKPTTTGFFEEGIFILTQPHCLVSDLFYSASTAAVLPPNWNIRITPVKLTLYHTAGKTNHCPEPAKCTQF